MKVDGPLSLLKLNRRYGINLAKLFPIIIQNRQWSVKAKILRHKGDRYLHNLEIDSQRHGKYLFAFDKPREMYDSRVEQNFANRFNALNTGWTLTREPEPIPVGRHVMIPDFAFQKVDMKVYMEVMGFWTPQYIHNKIEKLEHIKEVDMILAVDRKLACQKLDKIGEQLNVIYYKRQIPLQPVLAHLRLNEERLMEAHIKSLRYGTFNILDSIVEIKELAERLEVLENALKRVLKEKPVMNYVLLEDVLIKKSKLKEIKETLRNRLEENELNLREASQIIEDLGVKRPTRVLDHLGYEIEWHGIDPRSAKIRPK